MTWDGGDFWDEHGDYMDIVNRLFGTTIFYQWSETGDSVCDEDERHEDVYEYDTGRVFDYNSSIDIGSGEYSHDGREKDDIIRNDLKDEIEERAKKQGVQVCWDDTDNEDYENFWEIAHECFDEHESEYSRTAYTDKNESTVDTNDSEDSAPVYFDGELFEKIVENEYYDLAILFLRTFQKGIVMEENEEDGNAYPFNCISQDAFDSLIEVSTEKGYHDLTALLLDMKHRNELNQQKEDQN